MLKIMSKHRNSVRCVDASEYVSSMSQHAELPRTARKGRVCAGKYGDDPDLPEVREKNLRNRALRRRNWLKRRWQVSERGNDRLKIQEKYVSVFERDSGWAYWIGWTEYKPIFKDGKDTGRDDITEHSEYSDRVYETADEAKLALFDHLWPLADCFNVASEHEKNDGFTRHLRPARVLAVTCVACTNDPSCI